ncbi:CRISPR-associated protein Csm2 [Persephonella hydrogeniphila]|uniref:CRISPR system Cms protein Csm2 n=1 Tax=Persephonella hydrogeniphila TaxID=198703 RepID=A0A285NN77_9AQUI|nr:type III-A CRISPR-associated protein Csm2 [Persephonella hydrogeniphila]SNZ09081.1 CRISPR-associated protein Csm2 [Persephonella hydrogeniphila]
MGKLCDNYDNNAIEKFTQKILDSSSLSQILKPEEFAPFETGWAYKIVKQLKCQHEEERRKYPEFKTTQLRKIFTEIKEITQKQDKERLFLLYPKLAYSKGRKLIPDNFYKLLVTCLDKLKTSSNSQDFESFEKFIETIVAYNKYFESEK